MDQNQKIVAALQQAVRDGKPIATSEDIAAALKAAGVEMPAGESEKKRRGKKGSSEPDPA